MEEMMQLAADGQTPTSTTEVVSMVLSQSGASSSKFLKNVGLETTYPKTTKSSTEKELQEQLDKERQQTASFRKELEELKQKGEEAIMSTQRGLEEVRRGQEESRKRQEESNAILRRLLSYASQSH